MAYEFSEKHVARLVRNVRRLEHLARNSPAARPRYPVGGVGAPLNLAVSVTAISARVGGVLGSGRATFLVADASGHLTDDPANEDVKVWNGSSSVVLSGIHGFVFNSRGSWVFVPLDCAVDGGGG